jgi:hypothetical protein
MSREKTEKEKQEIRERSANGSGPRIVPPEFLRELEERGASDYIIKLAKRAIETNPI